MIEFNHLKNLCEFLDDAHNFEHLFFDAHIELDASLSDDPLFQYDEASGREVFAEHIFNLLVEAGADVDEDMANRLTDVIAPAFYHVNDVHYKESTALQNMLRAADTAAEKQCEQMAAGDYAIKKFKIVIDDYSAEFLLGGPQLDALYAFAHHIAYENGYEIKEVDGLTTVEE